MGVLLLEPLLVRVRMTVHDITMGMLVLVLDVLVVMLDVRVLVHDITMGVLVAVDALGFLLGHIAPRID
ncbi:MAG: hypothetical protein MSC31_03925 [Solirubrobacteraceae bacterium MAG38_C4-C5]|nr:hypothetical protein [Candidatus Siliceabacter maunaloa]